MISIDILCEKYLMFYIRKLRNRTAFINSILQRIFLNKFEIYISLNMLKVNQKVFMLKTKQLTFVCTIHICCHKLTRLYAAF